MKAAEIAAKAADLVGGDRDRQHGAKEDNFKRIAALWNAWISIRRGFTDLTAHDVGVMMALLKIARTQSGAHNEDDYVDAAGYISCAGEIAGDRNAQDQVALAALREVGFGVTPPMTPFWEIVGNEATMREAAAASDSDPLAR